MNYKRGDVVLVALSPVMGSEQADTRPGVVVSYELFHRLKWGLLWLSLLLLFLRLEEC